MAFETDKGVLKLITYVAVVANSKILLVDYVEPPNPKHSGWWIPAPELEFGEAPDKVARNVLATLGVEGCNLQLTETESFETPGAWHCIFHYVARPETEVDPTSAFRKWQWFSAEELPPAPEFAHGEWEQRLALRQLERASG